MFESVKDEGVQKRERMNATRGRGPRERGRGRGRPEMIQSHSIFEQGPGEIAIRKKGRNLQ